MKRIIVMYENVDREVNMSLYDYIEQQYRYAIPIIVCHVTQKEYSEMQKQLKVGCLNERLPRIRNNEEIGYDKFRYLIVYDSDNKELLISDYNNPKGFGSYRVNNEGIFYNNIGYKITNHPTLNRVRYKQKIYTTETYKDVISYYRLKQNKDYQIRKKELELIQLLGHSCKTCNRECTGGFGEKGCARWSHTIYYEK